MAIIRLVIVILMGRLTIKKLLKTLTFSVLFLTSMEGGVRGLFFYFVISNRVRDIFLKKENRPKMRGAGGLEGVRAVLENRNINFMWPYIRYVYSADINKGIVERSIMILLPIHLYLEQLLFLFQCFSFAVKGILLINQNLDFFLKALYIRIIFI